MTVPTLVFDATDRINRRWAESIAVLMDAQPPEYLRWFTPFPAEAHAIEGALQGAHVGLVHVSERPLPRITLVAVWFLSDWTPDPLFGIVVDHECRGMGLGRLCMSLAQSTVRLRGARRIRSSVWPQNEASYRINVRAGFVETGMQPDGQIGMEWSA